MLPRVDIKVDLPQLPPECQRACDRAGVSDRQLRSSWAAHVREAARLAFGRSRYSIAVRRHRLGLPSATAGGVSADAWARWVRLRDAWHLVEAQWVAAGPGTIAMLFAVAQGRARGT